jgi:S1-C subfamily serine protease
VILSLDGKPVRNSSDLRNRVGLVRVGEKIDVTYRRGNDERTTSMRVADLPQQSELPQQQQQRRQMR